MCLIASEGQNIVIILSIIIFAVRHKQCTIRVGLLWFFVKSEFEHNAMNASFQ